MLQDRASDFYNSRCGATEKNARRRRRRQALADAIRAAIDARRASQSCAQTSVALLAGEVTRP
jgi:hypothetical protein